MDLAFDLGFLYIRAFEKGHNPEKAVTSIEKY